MGLFNLFSKPLILEDDFFGSLRFKKANNSKEKSYFEGRGVFAPAGVEIEYFIDGEKTGPTEDQRAFYERVQKEFEVLIEKISPMIEASFRPIKPAFKIQDFKEEFTPLGMTIPLQDTPYPEWDISFETIHDENHEVMVLFKGFEPVDIVLDG